MAKKAKGKPSTARPPTKTTTPPPAPTPKTPAPAKATQAPEEQREHPRVSLGLLVQVRASSIDEFKGVHCENISLGGMFLRTAERRPLGAEIFFQLTLDGGGALIEGLARVVRIAEHGMGIQFISLLEPSATIVKKLVEERLAAER